MQLGRTKAVRSFYKIMESWQKKKQNVAITACLPSTDLRGS